MVAKVMIDYVSNNSSENLFTNEISTPKYLTSLNHFNETSWSTQMNYSNNINEPNQFYESNFRSNTNMQLNTIKNSDKMLEQNHFFDHLQNWAFCSNTITDNTFGFDYDYSGGSSSASTSAASSASSFMHSSNFNIDLRPPTFGIASTSTMKKEEFCDYSNMEIYDSNTTLPFSYQKFFSTVNNKEKIWFYKENFLNE